MRTSFLSVSRSLMTAGVLFVLTVFLPGTLVAQQKVTVVTLPLAQDLVKIFPELSSGYVDFTANGKPDQNADVNEYVPESRIRDGQLQAQEILDFLLENWRFLTLEKLKAVQNAVKNSQGAIGDLIAIDFGERIAEAVRLREALGDGLYLTPSALKEAMEKMGGIITAMATAYKKEGKGSDADFLSARDSLFQMIDRGYPLPKDLPAEERDVLTTALISVVMKEQESNAVRTRTAIRTLGLLKAPEAAGLLTELASGTAYPEAAIKALGEIGWRPAISVLAAQLKSGSTQEIRRAAFQATGAIGGSEALDAILDIVKPASRDSLSPELLEASTQALAGIAQKGNTDNRVLTALRELAGHGRPVLRRIAAGGLGAFPNNAQAFETLQALTVGDKDVTVRRSALQSLGRQQPDQVMAVLLRVLGERDLDSGLKTSALAAMGDNVGGGRGVPLMVDALADPDSQVRSAAVRSLKKLFPTNQVLVTGSLARVLGTSTSEALLVEGTSLLADLADPTSLPTLLILLAKPQPEVKRLAAWALYRIRSAANPKVMEELAKLVTNENETLAVRTTALRALGAIGFDSPQLNLAQTLVTIAGMRGEKYAHLRFTAVQALGNLLPMKSTSAAALVRLAARDADRELRKAAVTALRGAPALEAESLELLAASFREATDQEHRIRLVETLADLGAPQVQVLAGELLSGEMSPPLKRRVLSALAQNPGETSATLLLDAARDPALGDFLVSVLESFPRSVTSPVVTRRQRTEADPGVISVLRSLEALSGE